MVVHPEPEIPKTVGAAALGGLIHGLAGGAGEPVPNLPPIHSDGDT